MPAPTCLRVSEPPYAPWNPFSVSVRLTSMAHVSHLRCSAYPRVTQRMISPPCATSRLPESGMISEQANKRYKTGCTRDDARVGNMSLGLNILLVFVFLLLGSVFSGTELALVSLRGSQIDQMEQEDARGARVAAIARDPNTFLSTVQIGVTLSGFLSAFFGESAISPSLVPVVESWGVPAHVVNPLTTVALTLIISYCSIVLSEMVPKRIAMQRTEQIARAVVPAIDVFATICRPIIWLIGKKHRWHRPAHGIRPERNGKRGIRRRASRSGEHQLTAEQG